MKKIKIFLKKKRNVLLIIVFIALIFFIYRIYKSEVSYSEDEFVGFSIQYSADWDISPALQEDEADIYESDISSIYGAIKISRGIDDMLAEKPCSDKKIILNIKNKSIEGYDCGLVDNNYDYQFFTEKSFRNDRAQVDILINKPFDQNRKMVFDYLKTLDLK